MTQKKNLNFLGHRLEAVIVEANLLWFLFFDLMLNQISVKSKVSFGGNQKFL